MRGGIHLAHLVLLASIVLLPARSRAEDHPSGFDEQRALDAHAHFERGLDAYRAGDFARAIDELHQAYAFEPSPEHGYALAQALRLGQRCAEAIPLYQSLLDTDLPRAQRRAVEESMARCEAAFGPHEPGSGKPDDGEGSLASDTDSSSAAIAEARPPSASPSTDVGDTSPPPEPTPAWYEDILGHVAAGAGLIALGVSTGLLLSSSAKAADARGADTYDRHLALTDQAETERNIGILVGAAGIALVGLAIFRYLGAGSDPDPAGPGVDLALALTSARVEWRGTLP